MSPQSLPTTEAPRPWGRLDRGIAVALFAGTFLALLLTERAIGFPRDESVYFAAAESYARWFQLLLQRPAVALSDSAIVASWGYNAEHPGLMKSLFGLSFLIFHEGLGWARPATAFRLPAFAIAATIPVLCFLLGRRLFGASGRAVGLFAAVSFFLVPRQFFNAHLACFDIPVAAMWLATAYAYLESRERPWAWLWTGVAFGLTIATKHNGLFLPVLLLPFIAWNAAATSANNPQARRLVWQTVTLYAAVGLLFLLLWLVLGPERFQSRFILLSPHVALYLVLVLGGGYLLNELYHCSTTAFRAVAPLWAMTLLGPAIFYLHWPYLWHAPVDRTAWYLAFHAKHEHYTWFYLGQLLRAPPFPLEYVVVKTALTVPTSLFVPMVLGFLGVVGHALAALFPKGRARWGTPSPELLFVAANAVASIALISHPQVPHFGGVKHWFPSMPFLGLLAGASLVRGAEALTGRLSTRFPKLRFDAVAAVLGLFVCAPALWATARNHPYGTAYYSELAGGEPGAASLGMQRQFWSSHVTGVLDWLNANAPAGARVYLHEVRLESFRDYQRNGMLRADLRPAAGPYDAQFAAYQYHQEFKEHEVAIWSAFGTQKPIAGLYLDETPQVVLYRRP